MPVADSVWSSQEWGLGLSGMACLRLDQAQLEGDCVPDMLMLAVIEGSDGYFPTVPCYLNFTSSDNDTAWELGSPPMPPLCDNCTSEYPGQAPPAPPSSFLMWLQADVTQMFYRRHLSGQVTEEDWGSLAGWAQVAVTALAQDLADMSGVSRESVAIVAAEVVVYGRVNVTCTLPFPSESDAILANLTLAGYGIGSTSYFDHLAAEGFFVTLQHVAIAEVEPYPTPAPTTSPTAAPNPTPMSDDDHEANPLFVVGAAAGGAIAIVLLVAIAVFLRSRHHQQKVRVHWQMLPISYLPFSFPILLLILSRKPARAVSNCSGFAHILCTR